MNNQLDCYVRFEIETTTSPAAIVVASQTIREVAFSLGVMVLQWNCSEKNASGVVKISGNCIPLVAFQRLLRMTSRLCKSKLITKGYQFTIAKIKHLETISYQEFKLSQYPLNENVSSSKVAEG